MRKDWTGHVFTELTVIRFSHTDNQRRSYWLCRCRCDNEVTVRLDSLTSSAIVSCGCYRRELARRQGLANFQHGMSETPEGAAWYHMIDRCYNFTNPRFADYGGRGITVCNEWRESFERFFEDVGLRPSPQHVLDRHPDNNGDYEPGNIRWATRKESARNQRNNHNLTYDDRTQSIAAWVEETGISRAAILKRLKLGWTVKEILTTPTGQPRKEH